MSSFENEALRILSLEDSELDAELIQNQLAREKFSFQWRLVQTRQGFEQALETYRPALILSDYKLPTFDGTRALTIARERCPDVPVIIVSGAVGEETAVELLKNGATDFVRKDRLTRLVPAIKRALREVSEREARRQAEADLRRLNAELEATVTERTRELQEKNALMEEELNMTRELQQAFLPRQFPTLPRGAPQTASAVKFYSVYQPSASVSGDFFNVFGISDTKVGVFICDVMGHGVRAALITAIMRALEGQLGGVADDPGAFLTAINHALRALFRPSGTTLFTTAFYLIFDIAASRVTYANAGHPSPLHLRHSPLSVEPISNRKTSGPVLGIFDDVIYRNHQSQVHADDLLLFFTDGLIEAENPRDEAYSEQRLRETILKYAANPPSQLVNDILSNVIGFTNGQPFADDVCLVGMEITHLNSHLDAA